NAHRVTRLRAPASATAGATAAAAGSRCGTKVLARQRRALLERGGVNHDDLTAAASRLAVPEAIRVLDPRRRFGGIDHQSLVPLAQFHRALVVRSGTLRV